MKLLCLLLILCPLTASAVSGVDLLWWNIYEFLIYNFWICRTVFWEGEFLSSSFYLGKDYSIFTFSTEEFVRWLLKFAYLDSETSIRLKLIRFRAISLSLGILSTCIVWCSWRFKSSIDWFNFWMIESLTRLSDSKCSLTSIILFLNSYLSSSNVFISCSTLTSSYSFCCLREFCRSSIVETLSEACDF